MVRNYSRFFSFSLLFTISILNVRQGAAQIDFSPGIQYFYHQGKKTETETGTSRNYSHQFQAVFGFRKHWSSERFPYFNPYFGYMDVQQYFPSEIHTPGGAVFKEISSLKQRGAFIGCAFDYKLSERVSITGKPEFLVLSSGDAAKTEFYTSNEEQAGYKSKIIYRNDEIELRQETPVFRFNLDAGFKFNFQRFDLSLMYRLMVGKPYKYDKNVWYSVKDNTTGNTQIGSKNFQYNARLSGFGLQLRYLFLDWHY